MTAFERIRQLLDDGAEEETWDEETRKNWEEKMSEPLKNHPIDEAKEE